MRTLIRIVAVLVIIGGGGAFYVWQFMWNKKAPDASKGKAIVFTAVDLAKEYNQDEKLADSKYLDKKIEVNGVVSEIDKDQDGGVLVILQTSDPSAGVQCAMEDKGVIVSKGQNITIRGICTGKLMDEISLKGCKLKQ